MTLIAFVTPKGVPTFIGDLLLSRKSEVDQEVRLPFSGPVSKEESISCNYHISGLTQKVCVIAPQLAVAWAGRKSFAEKTIREMKEYFDGREVGLESLNSFFQTHDVSEEIKLICGLLGVESNLGNTGLCIGWQIDCSNASGIHGEAVIAGSGTSDLQNLLNRITESFEESNLRTHDNAKNFGSRDPDDSESKFIRGIYLGVEVCGNLIATEMINGGNLKNFHGGGNEICIGDAEGWHKIGNIAYVPWHYDADTDSVSHSGVYFKSDYLDDDLYIRALNLKDNRQNRADSPFSEVKYGVDSEGQFSRTVRLSPEFTLNQSCCIVSALNKDYGPIRPETIAKLPHLSGDIVCSIVMSTNGDYTSVGTLIELRRGVAEPYSIEIENGEFNIQWSQNYLNNLISVGRGVVSKNP